MGGQVHALVDIETFQRHRRAHRMPAICDAMAECADLMRKRFQPLVNLGSHRHGGHRKDRSRHLLGHGHQIGAQPPCFAAKPPPGAPETTDDFIGNQQDTVFGQHILHRIPIAIGRQNHPARAHCRFANERPDGARIFGLDHRVQLARAAFGKRGLGFARVRVTPVMRPPGSQHGRQRQGKPGVAIAQARQRRADLPRPVIGPVARDDALAVGLALGSPVIAHDLGRGFHRLGPGGAENHPPHPRHPRHQPRGQLIGQRRRAAQKGMVIGQPPHLLGHHAGQPVGREPKACTPQRRHRVDIAAAVDIAHPDTVAAFDLQRRGFVGHDRIVERVELGQRPCSFCLLPQLYECENIRQIRKIPRLEYFLSCSHGFPT